MDLNDLVSILELRGIGVFGQDLFIGLLPATPDACVSLLDYGGAPPSRVQNATTPKYEGPRFQVLVRATSYDVAQAKAHEVWAALSSVRNAHIRGTWYLGIQPLQSPFYLREDENRRTILACNFEAMKAA